MCSNSCTIFLALSTNWNPNKLAPKPLKEFQISSSLAASHTHGCSPPNGSKKISISWFLLPNAKPNLTNTISWVWNYFFLFLLEISWSDFLEKFDHSLADFFLFLAKKPSLRGVFIGGFWGIFANFFCSPFSLKP